MKFNFLCVSLFLSYVASSLYYKATDADGNLLMCMNFDPDFLSALEATFNVVAPSGEPYKLLTSLTLSQVMEKSKAYEVVLSKEIAKADVDAIIAALEAKWLAVFSGESSFKDRTLHHFGLCLHSSCDIHSFSIAETVDIHIALQQEYVNVNGYAP